MGKEILTFGDIEIEKNKFYHLLVIYVNTLLVTCLMIIKLSHCVYCFLKQAFVNWLKMVTY